jgi:hypothetical protein
MIEKVMKNPEIGRNKLLQMSESEIKLKIIRLIDSQNGETLKELYELILAKLYGKNKEESSFLQLKKATKPCLKMKKEKKKLLNGLRAHSIPKNYEEKRRDMVGQF